MSRFLKSELQLDANADTYDTGQISAISGPSVDAWGRDGYRIQHEMSNMVHTAI